MKKLFYLSIPILLTGIFVTAWIAFDERQPPGYRSALDQYITEQEQSSQTVIRVQAVTRASKPWEFIRDDNDPPSSPSLSYPPDEVWCILLKVDQNRTARYELVFAALHTSIYTVDWVIHPAAQPVSSPQVQQRVSGIGCDPSRLKIPAP
ncbi:MAG: hypothetical protein ACM3PY_19425 [Omnitrophica WOR_2 bacterium]